MIKKIEDERIQDSGFKIQDHCCRVKESGPLRF